MMLNRKFSKVLCAVLAFAMIVTMLPAMALVASADEATAETSVNKLAFSDIANSPYQSEIGVLNAISVLAGDPEGTFRPGDSISRAEMAAIIVRIYGLESTVIPGATAFDDVPADHWASGYVNIASSLGVINGDGDGKFRPDDKVKYNEAIKMLVCVLGYGMHAQESGGWPSGYIVMAGSLGIDEDVINTTGEASRETVSKLVYNTIDKDYLEKVGYGSNESYIAVEGRTLLSEKMKITKLEDIVSETYTSSVFGEGGLKEGQVRIGKTRMLLGGSDVSKYVGYPVIVYAKYDPKVDKELSTILHYEIVEEDVVIIEATPEDVAGATANSIVLYEDYENSRKLNTYVTNINTYIFKNAVGDMGFDLSTLHDGTQATFQGKITIIDVDDDQIIDSIFVETTDTIVVGEVKKPRGAFYLIDKYSNARYPSNNISTDSTISKVSIIKDGEEIDYTELSENDVLTCTSQGNVYNFVVSNKTVEGVVEAVNTDGEIVIDGVAYEKSHYFNESVRNSYAEDIEVGSTVTLYLDTYGEVAYVDVAIAGGAENYAYVLGAEYEPTFGGAMVYNLVMYTSDNEKVSLPFASKAILKKHAYLFNVNSGTLIYDATKGLDVETIEIRSSSNGVTEEDLVKSGVFNGTFVGSTLVPGSGTPKQQLVKYNLTDGKISMIETPLEIIPFAADASGNVNVTAKVGNNFVTESINYNANKSTIDTINATIKKLTPRKYDKEANVFTKTVFLHNGSELSVTAFKGSGYFSSKSNVDGDDINYKWKGSNVLFLPKESGTAKPSDAEYFSSDALFGGYNGYTTLYANEFEIYDCAKDGTAGMFVVTPDLVTPNPASDSDPAKRKISPLVANTRDKHMIITKVGSGVNADGEGEIRIVGQATPYSTNSSSEATITLSAGTAVSHRTVAGLTAADLKPGDIINYTALPNGKVYTAKLMYSVANDVNPFVYGHSGDQNIGALASDSLIQHVMFGYMISSATEDGITAMRLTTADSSTSIASAFEMGGANTSAEIDPTTYKNFWAYDTTKGTLKAITYDDIPIPEEVDAANVDTTNLPKDVYKVVNEKTGNEEYVKCPKVLIHFHKSAGNYKNINFIFFDDGSFDY